MSYGALGYWGVDRGAYDYEDIGFFTTPYERWNQNFWSSDQVYVFRFEVRGLDVEIEAASQVYPLIEAYVAAMPLGNKNQDIRGITLKPGGSGGILTAEIVFTDAGGVHLNTDRVEDTLEKMQAYLDFKRYQADVYRGRYAQMDTDKKEINAFWFKQPILWSSALFDSAGGSDLRFGFTDAFVKGRRGVWLNSSTARPQYELPNYEPPLLAPPRPRPTSGSGTPPDNRSTAHVVDDEETGMLPLIFVGTAAGLAVYYLYGRKARA